MKYVTNERQWISLIYLFRNYIDSLPYRDENILTIH